MSLVEMKRLDIECVERVYKERLIVDFVPEELKLLSVITSLMRRGLYLCYGMFDEGGNGGLCFFCEDRWLSGCLN
jgi:hypothetical protein